LPLPPQIRRAFRNLASKEHPDKGGNPDRFRAIQQAYEVLSHPARRQEYDATGTVVRTVEEEFVDSFGGGAPIMPIMSAQKYSAWMLAGT
jgi:DnaJ-class molecular chaperone